MTPAFAAKLVFSTWPTSISEQKIDSSALKMYGIAIARFLIENKLGRIRFFDELFLLADTKMKVVPGMPFLALSNADIWFDAESSLWKS